MTQNISRRSWLKRSAMAAAILPVSQWYPGIDVSETLDVRGTYATIKLNANENPYGPSEAARKAVIESLKDANRYPRNYIGQLAEEIARREGLTSDHVLITAGSTELLGLTGLMYGLQGGELVAANPTFDFMLLYAERIGCKWGRTPVTSDFQQDLNALAQACNTNTKLIFICNPNNPTGVEVPNETLRSFCREQVKKYPVFVDEAYIELSTNGRSSSLVNHVDQYPNLIIGRTFSKVHGLAGMRIGYALAHPDTITKLANYHIGREQSVSNVSAAAALACLHDPTFEADCRDKIIRSRTTLCKTFDDWGVKYLPSSTNFVFFNNEKFRSDPVDALAKDNILIRKYDHIPGWSRVSIGTDDEMSAFKAGISRYINS